MDVSDWVRRALVKTATKGNDNMALVLLFI